MASACSAFVAIDDFQSVPALLKYFGTASGGTLSAFEVMWQDWYQLIDETGNHSLPLATEYPYYLLVEWEGGDPEGDAVRFEEALAKALEQGWLADAAIAGSERERSAFWRMRDDIDGLRRVLGDILVFDVSLPLVSAEAYTAGVFRRLVERWPDTFRGATFGHLGDGNVHFIMTVGPHDDGDAHAAMDIVYDELREYGGSISAEHGIGLEKKPWLDVSRTPEEIAMMRKLKAALDPRNILNPGRVAGA
jgi:FAD/FMN-containing dehydrogenase